MNLGERERERERVFENIMGKGENAFLPKQKLKP